MTLESTLTRLMDRLDRLERIQERGPFEVPRTKIAEVSGTGSSAVLEFSGIPSAYRTLVIDLVGRSSNAGGFNSVLLTFESSPTAGAYDYNRLLGVGTSAIVQENVGTNAYIFAGAFPGSTAAAAAVGSARIILPEYANTAVQKTAQIHSFDHSTLVAGGVGLSVISGLWESTAAISLIRLTLQVGNWETLSLGTLWGAG